MYDQSIPKIFNLILVTHCVTRDVKLPVNKISKLENLYIEDSDSINTYSYLTNVNILQSELINASAEKKNHWKESALERNESSSFCSLM